MDLFVWMDALTPKQALFAASLTRYLKDRGADVLITARRHDYTLSVLKLMGARFVEVGEYGGVGPLGKLRAGIERQSKLAEFLIKEGPPHVHISLASPDGMRVAFGLGMLSIAASDSPHSFFVNKLSLPLADYVVAPGCIPRTEFSYAIDPSLVICFDGTLEAAWIREWKEDRSVLEILEIEEGLPIVVLRPEEYKASYYGGRRGMLRSIASELPKHAQLVVFPRYPEQFEEFKHGIKCKVIMPSEAVDTVSLFRYSSIVITGGATFAQEASLLGTPSITLFPHHTYVEEFLRSRGFPIFHVTDFKLAVDLVLEVLENPDSYRVDTGGMIDRMEDPRGIIYELIMELLSFDSRHRRKPY